VASFNLALILSDAGRPAEALRVSADGLRANPPWADDPRHYVRFNAGRYALFCAEGKGSDVPLPAERPAYRRQALEFLTADLAGHRKLAATDPRFVYRRTGHWLVDPELASVRDRAALEQLPLDERVAWVKLWTEVSELRAATTPAEQAPPPRPVKR
jgi:hypothetical protein